MDEALIQKEKEYKAYIDNHINNVHIIYQKYGKTLCERLGINYERLGDQIQDHDLSKYSKEEFDGFRCYYYPTPEEEADTESRGYRKKRYDSAWLHHLRNNAHHPEFWLYTENEITRCKPMDKMHVAEMIIDWAAMGMVFRRSAFEYWHDNIHDKPLNPETIALVDSCIDIFKDIA